MKIRFIFIKQRKNNCWQNLSDNHIKFKIIFAFGINKITNNISEELKKKKSSIKNYAEIKYKRNNSWNKKIIRIYENSPKYWIDKQSGNP